ncbi:UDP-2,3-diacylglucosamine diphosphatase [Nitrosomonas sp. ANs5]|uniref:UDP-2,3-diacylglucosamine diphosphatase n=1 Tax=Nitrosomonas sp. ANs5 TaxID=3423941 RepID=UPI003D354B19
MNIAKYLSRNTLTPSDLPSEAQHTQPDTLKPKVRTVFISDLHLGTPGCQATELLDFLKAYPCEQLYLVGDIIDGWQLRRG